MKMELNTFEFATLKKAIDTYGIRSQEDVAIEEMSELTKAIIKNRRYETEEAKVNIAEEIADVFIMLAQLTFVYGRGDNFDAWDFIKHKIDRLNQNLTAEKPHYRCEKCGETITQEEVITGCGFCKIKQFF